MPLPWIDSVWIVSDDRAVLGTDLEGLVGIDLIEDPQAVRDELQIVGLACSRRPCRASRPAASSRRCLRANPCASRGGDRCGGKTREEYAPRYFRLFLHGASVRRLLAAGIAPARHGHRDPGRRHGAPTRIPSNRRLTDLPRWMRRMASASKRGNRQDGHVRQALLGRERHRVGRDDLFDVGLRAKPLDGRPGEQSVRARHRDPLRRAAREAAAALRRSCRRWRSRHRAR